MKTADTKAVDSRHDRMPLPSTARRILFYDDAPNFGGHEVMTLYAVRWLLENTPDAVHFLFSAENTRLEGELERLKTACPALQIHPVPFQSGAMQGLRSRLSLRAQAHLRETIRPLAPTVVCVAQGSIEIASLGLLAAKAEGCFTVSYLPLAQPIAAMGTRFGTLRDRLNTALYRLPDRYITCTRSVERDIRARGATADIRVDYYGLELDRYRSYTKTAARTALGLDQTIPYIGLVGRVFFQQKAQNFLLKAFAAHREILPDKTRLVFVGDGPDLPALKVQVETLLPGNTITFLPWTNDLSAVYSALDVLAIPSRYEGLPVVMLEGMYFGLPIAASDVDGMAEVLPEAWRSPFGDGRRMMEVLRRLLTTDQSAQTAANRHRIETEFTLERYGRTFSDALSESAYHPPAHFDEAAHVG